MINMSINMIKQLLLSKKLIILNIRRLGDTKEGPVTLENS